MAEQEQLDPRERRKRRREMLVIALLSALFLALTVAEFKLTKVSSTLPFVTSIFFFGLLNVNIVILIALVWLVSRNLGKLFLERRRKILGSSLKAKLVLSFISLSIIPTLVLFVISAMYINSSFDKWFSLKIQNTLQASLEITRTYYLNTDHTAMHFAEHLAKGVGKKLAPPEPGFSLAGARPAAGLKWMDEFLQEQRELLALDAVEFYLDPLSERFVSTRSIESSTPPVFHRLSLEDLDRAFGGEHFSVMQHVGAGDLIRCLVPVHAWGQTANPIVGVIAVSFYIPVSLVNKVDEIASVFDDYKDTNPLKYPMKTTYLVILIMITLVIIFVAIWIGIYVARELTIPVERLVHGAQAVGAGNLEVRIASRGHDEIAVLVDSFNKMTQDLKDNRARLVQAGSDLEQRRLQLETVLANVGTGVVAIDRGGEVTTLNRAAAQLLKVDPAQANRRAYSELFQGPLAELIARALSGANGGLRSEKTQWTTQEDSGEGVRTLSALATPLGESEGLLGVVVVVDDMTHLIKGQREMAWREVARRIAHEIKNPLTPIKLSAQRLQRRLGPGRDGSSSRAQDMAVLQECTDTIIKHTDELKEMVNEFSNFARFPEASPAPHDLNEAIDEVARLYRQAHQDVQFKVELEPKLPIFDFDRDQLKRVMINLLDNAVAAVAAPGGSAARKVSVATHYNAQLEMAVIEVKDSGPGMPEDVRARAFEPYFSTKKDGTGLGLAIAKRIVNDHDGFIRVHSAPDEGTQFVIELPTSQRTDR